MEPNKQSTDLYMVRMRFHVGRLFTLGRIRRLPLGDVDPGYLCHCQMDELFGDNSPAPFSIIAENDRFLTLLAYSSRSAEELRSHAETFADPGVFNGCNWDDFHAKKMPVSWNEGALLGFEVRCIPTWKPRNGDGKQYERDAFLVSCMNADSNQEASPAREQVYRKWLQGNMHYHSAGGVELLSSRLLGWCISKMLRRKGPEDNRTSSTVQLPDVTMKGQLRITNPEGFEALLKRGVGKHRAFGFGMLLLKPPQ